MSTYEIMKQELPAYGQPGVGGYQQQPGQYMQTVPLPNSGQGTHPASEVQHHDEPPPRRGAGDDTDDEGSGDEDLLGPGEIPDKALNLEFDKCFHEHKSTKTFPQLHTCLGITYKYTKLVVYHIFVILIGIPMALLWALINGIMVFILVWIYQPALRMTIMWIYAVTPLATVPLQAIFTPLVDVGARIFRQIRIKAKLDGSLAERFAAGQSGHNRTHSV